MTTEGRLSPVRIPRDDPSSDDDDSEPTGSEDEFDWEAEEEDAPQAVDPRKAKRIRRCWLLYHRLSHGVRMLIIGILGTAICITPYIVFQLKFRHSVAYDQGTAWSLWLAISYAAVRVAASPILSFSSKIGCRLSLLR